MNQERIQIEGQTMTDRELLQKALKALYSFEHNYDGYENPICTYNEKLVDETVAEIELALSQVEHVKQDRNPLTDDEIEAALDSTDIRYTGDGYIADTIGDLFDFARAIERKHGIKGNSCK